MWRVCTVCWFALLCAPSSPAASPAPAELLSSPLPKRWPPAVLSARPAPCGRKTNCNGVPNSLPHHTCAALTSSWAASPPAVLAAGLTAPPHRWRERRRPNACVFLCLGSLHQCRARGGYRGAAGVASEGTTPTGRSLAPSGCSPQTERRPRAGSNEHTLHGNTAAQ